MEKNKLVICDLKSTYAIKLMDYLMTKKNIPFEIYTYTETNKFLEFAQTEKIDILLISEEAAFDISQELDTLMIGEVFILTEDGETGQIQGHKSIYKYQNTENILREVMCYYAESGSLIQSRVHKCSDMEMIAVYSPIKRSLKTSFSIVLGQILAEKKRVLYINMETYSGFNSLMKTTYMTDMSDLMYYISQEKPNFIWKLASMVQNIGGLDYIPPALSPLDIRCITGQQWITFFSELNKCNYDIVVLDIGDSVSGIYEILRMCTKVFTPTKDDAVSYAKMEQYESVLKIMNYDDVLEKTRKLSFSFFNGVEKGLDRLVYSELGHYVRKILIQEGMY